MRRRIHCLVLFQTTLLGASFPAPSKAFGLNLHHINHHNNMMAPPPGRRNSLQHRREPGPGGCHGHHARRPACRGQAMSLSSSTATGTPPSLPCALDFSREDILHGPIIGDHRHVIITTRSPASCGANGAAPFTTSSSSPSSSSSTTLTSSKSASSMTKSATKCSWAVMLAMLAFGQFFAKNSTAPLMGSSPADGSKNNLIYSTVSATLLRRQDQRASPVQAKLQFLLTWGFVLWQLSSKAGPVVRVLLAHVSMFPSWYMGVLDTSPLITKSLTTAVIGLLGDTGAQCVEERIRARKEGSKNRWFQNYDRRRGLSNVGGSLLVTGPLLHLAFNVLEDLIPVAGGGAAASVAALTQVLINDFLLDAVFVAMTFVTTGVAEGYASQIVPQLRSDYFATIKASWTTSLALVPLEFVCFRFLPLSFRVLGMNFIDIFWEALISYMIHRRRQAGKPSSTSSASASSFLAGEVAQANDDGETSDRILCTATAATIAD